MGLSHNQGSHTFFPTKIIYDISLTFHDLQGSLSMTTQRLATLHNFLFYIITSIRNIKFYQLQAIMHPIYYWK